MLEFERDGAELFASVVEAKVLARLRDEFTSLNLKAGGRSFDLSPVVLELLSPSGGLGKVAGIYFQAVMAARSVFWRLTRRRKSTGISGGIRIGLSQ